MAYSIRYEQALAFAAWLHQKQIRKGSGVPYISHLLAVSGLVIENGGNEDEAIAALERALAIQPDNPVARRLLEQLIGG